MKTSCSRTHIFGVVPTHVCTGGPACDGTCRPRIEKVRGRSNKYGMKFSSIRFWQERGVDLRRLRSGDVARTAFALAYHGWMKSDSPDAVRQCAKQLIAFASIARTSEIKSMLSGRRDF